MTMLEIKIVITLVACSMLIGGSMGIYSIATRSFYNYNFNLIMGTFWIGPIPLLIGYGIYKLWRI